LNEFDSLSMSGECTFTMNLGLPMGLRLDDDTLVVLSVEPGGQVRADDVWLSRQLRPSRTACLFMAR
jgi:hypothetical protein